MSNGMGLNPANYSLQMPSSATPYVAQASTGGASAGATIGESAGGAISPGVGNIIGAIAGATIGGIFDWIQGDKNRAQQEKMFNEQKQMAERQFGWGQELDRFNMDMASRQQNEAEKAQRFQITQAQVDRLNQILRTNQDVQNHVRSLWGGK